MDDLQAGHALDRLIAIEIMGLPERTYGRGMKCPECGGETDFRIRAWCFACCEWFYSPYREYSSLIDAAWEVVERLRPTHLFELHQAGSSLVWAAFQSIEKEAAEISTDEGCYATEAPHAICLAALAAVSQEEKV